METSPKKRFRLSPSSNDRHNLRQAIDVRQIFNINLPNQNKASTKCKCKHSKCLKLYCECFSQGQHCGVNCDCSNCYNREEFANQIRRAKQTIMTRNPTAFSDTSLKGTRGCKCVSSGCIKKYCECFRAGINCTDVCNCINCGNGKNGGCL